MQLVTKLRGKVVQNCISKDGDTASLNYWSDVIFAESIFALTPLSLLTIIPAVIICLQTESYLILGFDLFVFVMLIFIAYIPGIAVSARKYLLIFLLFLASFILLIELGSFGPGLVYLLGVTIFMLLFFPDKNPYLPFSLTLVFCIIYGFILHFNLISTFPEEGSVVGAWIAISSNVLFLSAMMTLMIPFFFSKLDSTLKEKVKLLESIRKTNNELNKSIAEVKVKNSELEEYAFVASHDLQEQLRMISSFLDKLSSKYQDQLDQKAHQYISFATEGAHRMRQIIQELLNHSNAGRYSEEVEVVSLQDLLNDYLISRNKIILEKSVQFIADQLPTILANKCSLTQTFHCLLDNAITYSKKDIPPKIQIKVEDHPEEWLFSIQDNGIGIDQRFFEKIFVIFQRLHNRGEYSGTGVGLSIVKKNVESWGGKIWLESTPGEGSTFYFTHPITA
ncbi:ATP-binding protein [Algoriphagus sp.]|uniref:ATP-binding protein n=1 Tax=Algoriphagus sp. TaxID=1872435 RepID=UPI00391C1B26